MAHWNARSVESSKNKVIDAIDENFELEEIRKKIRKDAREMSQNELHNKWQNKILIKEALEEVRQ